MITPIKIPAPEVVRPFVVPALGVGALYAHMEHHEGQHHQAKNLGDNMAGIAISVYLDRINHGLLPLTSGILMLVRANKKKTWKEKIKSVVQDSVWLGSGILMQRLLTGKGGGYLSSCFSFAIGSLLLAPFINNKILFRNHKEKSPYFEKIKAVPISMDRYGIINKFFVKPKQANNDNNGSTNH